MKKIGLIGIVIGLAGMFFMLGMFIESSRSDTMYKIVDENDSLRAILSEKIISFNRYKDSTDNKLAFLKNEKLRLKRESDSLVRLYEILKIKRQEDYEKISNADNSVIDSLFNRLFPK